MNKSNWLSVSEKSEQKPIRYQQIFQKYTLKSKVNNVQHIENIDLKMIVYLHEDDIYIILFSQHHTWRGCG